MLATKFQRLQYQVQEIEYEYIGHGLRPWGHLLGRILWPTERSNGIMLDMIIC